MLLRNAGGCGSVLLGRPPNSASASLAALARGTPPASGKGGEGERNTEQLPRRVKPGAEAGPRAELAGGSDLIRTHLEMISPQII